MRQLIRVIRNTFLTVASVGVMASSASAEPTVNWDMPTPYPVGIFHERNIQMFTDEIEKGTNGALHIEIHANGSLFEHACLLYTSPSPRDGLLSRMPSSA